MISFGVMWFDVCSRQTPLVAWSTGECALPLRAAPHDAITPSLHLSTSGKLADAICDGDVVVVSIGQR